MVRFWLTLIQNRNRPNTSCLDMPRSGHRQHGIGFTSQVMSHRALLALLLRLSLQLLVIETLGLLSGKLASIPRGLRGCRAPIPARSLRAHDEDS